MSKPAIIVVLAALLAVSCTAPWASSSSAGSTSQEIRIASDLPLAGPLGLGARPLRDAIALAIHDQGKVGGYRLSYMSLDDSLNGTLSPDKAEQNMRLAVNDPNVLAVIGNKESNLNRTRCQATGDILLSKCHSAPSAPAYLL